MHQAVTAGSADTILHDYWRSTASYRVRIALALKGLRYERKAVDLAAGAQRSAAYLAVNPQGLAPALEIDGRVLTQSLAIIGYLDETRPHPPLLPPAPMDRAHVCSIALAIACDIHPVSNLKVLAKVEQLAGAEARAAWNRDNIRAGLAAVEQMLGHPGFKDRFCFGETPTLADCALIPQLYNARRWGVDYDHLARIGRVEQSCAREPAFLAAAPERFDPASAHTSSPTKPSHKK